MKHAASLSSFAQLAVQPYFPVCTSSALAEVPAPMGASRASCWIGNPAVIAAKPYGETDFAFAGSSKGVFAATPFGVGAPCVGACVSGDSQGKQCGGSNNNGNPGFHNSFLGEGVAMLYHVNGHDAIAIGERR